MTLQVPSGVFRLALLITVHVWYSVECLSGDGKTLWSEPLNRTEFLSGTFPEGFLWGVGTAAFPTEGSWDRDGKGASVWDHFTHNSLSRTTNLSNRTADASSDSYALWEKDVEAVKYLGVNFYSFSISWPRIFPDGNATGSPNRAAVEHYRRLIARLKSLDLEPVVTLFHWDLPQVLQDNLGGWRNPDLVQIFSDYAAFCFRTFGRDVRYWITMHNPLIVAFQGYRTGLHAPGVTGDPADPFIVAHNLIRAHAESWHLYDRTFRPRQRGRVSITLASHWVEPFKGQATPASLELCQRSVEAVLGWFAQPIHGGGDYPASLRSSHPGLLPHFTPEEKLRVRGTADFFSLAFGPETVRAGRMLARYGQAGALDLRKVLCWVQREYQDPPVLVAESGWFSDASVGVDDTVAMYLMKSFINQVLQAVVLDRVQVLGYTAWSLVDGFEWNSGFSIRRGLFHIDFNQSERSRVPKSSAQYYRRVVQQHGFPAGPAVPVRTPFSCTFQFGVADFILPVNLQPFSPQFTDPLLYRWNLSGDGSLHPVPGVRFRPRAPQCTDFLYIKRHVRLLEATGASHYRFALDWPGLFPNGDHGRVDAEAVRYYRCVLAELQKAGVRTAVSLYHPSLRSGTLGMPGQLHAHGGWTNSSTVDAFVQYATFCFEKFGSLVSLWITVNEPNRLVEAYTVSEEERAAVFRNILLAHGRAWNVYHERFRPQQGATVSFALHADWVEPANPFVESHSSAAQRFLKFELGRFLDPFLKVVEGVGSEAVNVTLFSDEEATELRGALDFIALNHFTTRLIHQDSVQDRGWSFMSDPTWTSSGRGQALVPWGLRRVLNWVKDRYGNSRHIIVSAAGIDDQASHDDGLRQRYIRSYLQEALKARNLDGVDLRGFYVWKLQDSRSPDFGLFFSPHHHSRPKASVSVYRELVLRLADAAQGRYAQQLLNDLIENYSNALRPVEDTDKTLNVTLQVTLSQIKDMDERNQVLIAYLWIRQTWYDAYLKWDKDKYDGLEVIRIPSSLVWRPDVVLYNKADDDLPSPLDTNVVLRYTGEITWDAPAITKSSCVVDVSYFPFDRQQCNLTFGSWTYNGNQVDITMAMASGDLSDLVENVEWECDGMPATRNVIMYGCCSDPYPDITYTLLLRRRSSFYIFNLLLPCFLISFLAPLGFFLPADSGEKVSLGVTVLLALTVFQLVVAESMPPSESVPLIGKYYIATMTMITASTSLTIFIMNIHFCGPEAKPVPHWAKVLIIGYMSRMFFVYEVGESCTSSLGQSDDSVQHHKPNLRHKPTNQNPEPREKPVKPADLCCPEDEKLPALTVAFDPCIFCGPHCEVFGGDLRLVGNVEYIAGYFREQKLTCLKVAEWKKVAKVMDRFFMWIFFIMVFVMSILIVGKSS
ncbi:beta-klotho [Trichomycterus rosablanca]|uniref:beta-klotho n=1 Tax=Trichomycterus rosablanca TaxID=2290929 RepID=UPI002F35502E